MVQTKNGHVINNETLRTLSVALFMTACVPLSAATLCVNPGGTGGCFSTIQHAVSHASANDTIEVAPGTYKEDVIIPKPLSLVGDNRQNTTSDAKGLPNGIYIDGINHPGLGNVVVSGFTVENANFEGILVTNAFSVTLWNNRVINNNKSLNISAATCPGLPSFETAEGEDCGEGIHRIAVYQSVVSDNVVEHNSGGILLSDETAATHDNLIATNRVNGNPFDCGITLASHPPASGDKPLGVFHNTISHN